MQYVCGHFIFRLKTLGTNTGMLVWCEKDLVSVQLGWELYSWVRTVLLSISGIVGKLVMKYIILPGDNWVPVGCGDKHFQFISWY